jgi:hypothetical protein
VLERKDEAMNRTSFRLVAAAIVALAAGPAVAQTTQPGDAIDIEIFNPDDGGNSFCVAQLETLTARVFVRPGTDTTACSLSCSPPLVPGGSANIATAVLDLAFDGDRLSYLPGSIQNNPDTAAIQGIAQEQNVGENRIGWALAGSWSTPGDTGSTLLSPCDMQMVTDAGWLFSVQFEATDTGLAYIRFRRETDDPPFALSLADICGTEAFKMSNGGIDEVVGATVLIDVDCANALFFDSFESASVDRWSGTPAN